MRIVNVVRGNGASGRKKRQTGTTFFYVEISDEPQLGNTTSNAVDLGNKFANCLSINIIYHLSGKYDFLYCPLRYFSNHSSPFLRKRIFVGVNKFPSLGSM